LGRLAPAKPLLHPMLLFPAKLEPVKMGSFRIQESHVRKLGEIQAVSQAQCHGAQLLVWMNRAEAVRLSQARFYAARTLHAMRQPLTNALAAMEVVVQLIA
jgi:hypothetical protein